MVDNGNGTKTIALSGELIDAQSAAFQVIIAGELANKVALDLSGITMIDKSGVESLIAATSSFTTAGGQLAVAAAPPTIAATIQANAGSPTLHTDTAAAIASFSN